eukprot:gnl/TRDRNA2_/TRDRNA2_81776_c0_seq1.p1 gnl/TRDRNA2_/TRDRNA2_81776_c0~~gnl/TRDRNA2_/TRDRNA2_81776_c0_seq1.p1  ORF type:complete len:747 (+),score=180.16 gnl/TRDRNA2_/TRDRNA2_81776_c0_seq1:134-2374(+)
MAGVEIERGHGGESRIISLPQMQNLMKRDPESYQAEFEQQWLHFKSMLDILKLKPQKPDKNFSEQVMFLAHVSPSFSGKGPMLPTTLISVLSEFHEVLHPETRRTLVQALILLRNRDQFPIMQTLPLYFKLFAVQDKNLRTMVFSHIIKDLVQVNTKCRNQKTTRAQRDFFFVQMKDAEVEVARRAAAVFVSLYRQSVWSDSHVVNLMSTGLLHPDLKISAALTHLFLGNKTKGLEGILEQDSDKEEDDEDVNDAVMGIVGAKKTARREKRVKRAKKAAKKKQAKMNKGDNTAVSFVAIDLLNDAQALADRLLQRAMKAGEPYLFRLLILHLVARLVGRHSLQLLNLYPFLIKYLTPRQTEVTKVLACLVESSHPQVPPDELRPVVIHVLQNFVTESQAPEVIEVGLNAIREVCSRSVNILNEEELADLSEFRKFKNKGVSVAARSLINVYRELHPQLLHRSLRGREATMALSRGEVKAPKFGEGSVCEEIDGLELLAKRRKRHRDEDTDEEEGGNESEDGEESVECESGESEELGEEEGEEELEEEDGASVEEEAEKRGNKRRKTAPDQDAPSAKQMMTEQVLSSEDFKKLRKARLQRSVERQLGGNKRKAEDMSSSSSSESEGEDDDESGGSEEEQGLYGRLPGPMSGDQLKGQRKKDRTKAGRMRRVEEGRTDFKEVLKSRHKARKGGKTNTEQRRNKPQMMLVNSRKAKRKERMTAKSKVANLKKHIDTLKKKVGGKQKRRR